MGKIISLSGSGDSRIEVKQSVFIGRAVHVETAEEANLFVKSERDKYPDARHTVYAWKISGSTNMQKYSDDGEPSGTAGMPVLSLLEHNDITNSAIAVTRYFGGILLGKGGLVKAYTDCAKAALNDAVPAEFTDGELTKAKVSYSLSDKVLFELKKMQCEITDSEYAEDVRFTFAASEEESARIRAMLTDLTGGNVEFSKEGKKLIRGRELIL